MADYVKNRMRVEWADYEPEGFKIGFALGRLAVEGGYEYQEIQNARKYLGSATGLAYDMGVHVYTEAGSFLRESEEVVEVQNV
jgi:hypothetical protein